MPKEQLSIQELLVCQVSALVSATADQTNNGANIFEVEASMYRHLAEAFALRAEKAGAYATKGQTAGDGE
jgi:hypothetical protein